MQIIDMKYHTCKILLSNLIHKINICLSPEITYIVNCFCLVDVPSRETKKVAEAAAAASDVHLDHTNLGSKRALLGDWSDSWWLETLLHYTYI